MGRPTRQECIKRLAGKCALCLESDYHTLDVHRILPGRAGGTYRPAKVSAAASNTVCLCANCHRRVEAGEIEILGNYPTTRGVNALHVRRNGGEEWVWPERQNGPLAEKNEAVLRQPADPVAGRDADVPVQQQED